MWALGGLVGYAFTYIAWLTVKSTEELAQNTEFTLVGILLCIVMAVTSSAMIVFPIIINH